MSRKAIPGLNPTAFAISSFIVILASPRPPTGGKVVATLVRANKPPEEGTSWHRHIADFHIVIMLKGWARFMYEDQLILVEAGDCVHQRPGIVHYLFDYSKDMEYLEVAGPANFGTVGMPAPCEVPAVTPWT
jgi:quercetin dioxygenase-like cupin family protein